RFSNRGNLPPGPAKIRGQRRPSFPDRPDWMTGPAGRGRTGVSMNTRRSYLDTLNAGRQRRPEPAMEDLDRTLASLEGRLQRGREPQGAREGGSREPITVPMRGDRYQPAAPAARGSYPSDLRAL